MGKSKDKIHYNKKVHYPIPLRYLCAENYELAVVYTEDDGRIPDGMDCSHNFCNL